MNILREETIAAIATPAGYGGIGVIRISGPLSLKIASILTRKTLQPKIAQFCTFYHPKNANVIDQGIVLYFPAPHSFTGEEVIEFQAHGGPIVLNTLLEAILEQGARQAQAGEFSLRAFLNHKIDLAQTEAICDLIHATSQQAAQSAVHSLQGHFSKKIQTIVSELIHIRVHLEAHIDFPDEEIDDLSRQLLLKNLKKSIQDLKHIQAVARQGQLLRDGLRVVIAGKPNAGKSTLLNQLCEAEVAIVSEQAGTTRDLIREHLNFDGIPLLLIDTAGIHETEHAIEQEGIRRAFDAIQKADLLLFIHDSQWPFDEDYFALFENQIEVDKVIVIYNKIDLNPTRHKSHKINLESQIFISAKTGSGIKPLKECIRKKIGLESGTEGVFSARLRHLQALKAAKDHLEKAYDSLYQNIFIELVAEECRLAMLELNRITGEFSSDDLLGEIFSTFCIGK